MSGVGNIWITQKNDETKEPTNHVHDYMIDRPEGKYSNGYCACGAIKRFLNYDDLESKDWNGRQRGRDRFNDSKKS